MGCSLDGIPSYLHYEEGNKIYNSKDFRSYQLLFRTGFKDRENPIEFPRSLTAISVCWSKLINPKDVYKTVVGQGNPEKLGNHVYYGRIKSIKNILIIDSYKNVKDCPGEHKIETEIIHSPEPCNYSHSEIMIKHTYMSEGKLIQEIISKKDFEDRKCLLRKKLHKEFFQPLILKYESRIATLLNSDIRDLDIPWYNKILSKNIVVSFSLWKALTFRNK